MSWREVSAALNQISLIFAENPADIYLFQAAIETPVQSCLLSLLLNFNRFHALFWCFHCWVWTRKFQLESCRLSEKLHAIRIQNSKYMEPGYNINSDTEHMYLNFRLKAKMQQLKLKNIESRWVLRNNCLIFGSNYSQLFEIQKELRTLT